VYARRTRERPHRSLGLSEHPRSATLIQRPHGICVCARVTSAHMRFVRRNGFERTSTAGMPGRPKRTHARGAVANAQASSPPHGWAMHASSREMGRRRADLTHRTTQFRQKIARAPRNRAHPPDVTCKRHAHTCGNGDNCPASPLRADRDTLRLADAPARTQKTRRAGARTLTHHVQRLRHVSKTPSSPTLPRAEVCFARGICLPIQAQMSTSLVLVTAARAGPQLCGALRALRRAIVDGRSEVSIGARDRPLSDDAMPEFGRLVGCARMIQSLSLWGHTAVTPAGWGAFLSGALKNPNFARLVLSGAWRGDARLRQRARARACGRFCVMCARAGRGVFVSAAGAARLLLVGDGHRDCEHRVRFLYLRAGGVYECWRRACARALASGRLLFVASAWARGRERARGRDFCVSVWVRVIACSCVFVPASFSVCVTAGFWVCTWG
jgi:hypothetical protein